MVRLHMKSVMVGVVVTLLVSTLVALPRLSADELDETTNNIVVIEQVIDQLWNDADLGNVDHFYAPTFYAHRPDMRAKTLFTPADWQRVTFETMRGMYPDLEVTINEVIAQGDRVVVDFTARGTHTGDVTVNCSLCRKLSNPRILDYRNVHFIPATGTRDTWDGVLMYRLENSKVVEEWWYWNGDIDYR